MVGESLGAGLGSAEEPIFFTELGAANRAFTNAVVHRDISIEDEQTNRIPALVHVGTNFCKQRIGHPFRCRHGVFYPLLERV